MIKKAILFIAPLLPFSAIALEDSLQKSIEMAIAGNEVQSERIKIATENIANQHTTSDKPGGDAYRRKILFAKNTFDKKKNTNLVKIKKYDEDKSDFVTVYSPNHPAADANGYVKYPNVRSQIEIADQNEASRAYEANLGVIELSRSMMQKTLDVIGK